VSVDAALRALAHPTRRAMLELVWDDERPSSDIATAVAVSRPTASQHLKVLRDAGLVHVRVDGNHRLYRVDLDRLAEVRDQLEAFWAARIDRLVTAVAAGRARPTRRRATSARRGSRTEETGRS
jgi:DNA-binding transcriptional ArsR family regulator